VTDLSPPRLLSGAAVLRRGWIVVLVAGAAALAALAVATSRPTSYTAEGLVTVLTAAGPRGPGSANDATTLARTYATVIPEDDRVARNVARAVGRPLGDARERVSVINDPGTSALRLVYRDADARRARVGAVALTETVLRSPRRSAVGRGSLGLVRRPAEPRATTPDTRQAIVIGLLLGAFAGCLLFLGWERADRRIDHERDLREAFPGAASSLSGEPESVLALRERWKELAGVARPRVGIVAVNAASVRVAHRASAVLTAQAADDEEMVLRVGGPVGGPAEHLALQSEVVVLAVAKGSPTRDVARTVTALEQFGRRPQWALLLPSAGLFGRLRAGNAGAAPAPAPALVPAPVLAERSVEPAPEHR
jgi:hypothetical protein